MNVRDDSTTGDCCLDEGIQFFITANSQLQVARGDAFDLEILAGIAGQFEYFGREVFQYGGRVHGRSGTHAVTLVDGILEEAVHAADGKLQTRLGGARLRGLL